jgi:fused signal recognition particle receptor
MGRLFRRPTDGPRGTLWQRIKELALTDVTVAVRGGVDEGSLEKLEEMLLEADFGVATTSRLVAGVEHEAREGVVRTRDELLAALRSGVAAALRTGDSDPTLTVGPQRPTVILVIGVNGAGKTTFIGKLSARLRGEGRRVLIAAGDTFRAGAVDQLRVWADRTGAQFIGGATGRDPAAVAVDALEAAVASGVDVVLIDTAGRLHTSSALMDELKKVVRVIAKRYPGAPHETLLVLDATIGQNAIAQGQTFAAAVPITGLVVTKVDGTAKGGVVVAVHEALNVPVKFIGMGETADDLVQFDAEEFARELLET